MEQHLKEVMRRVEEYEVESEWDRTRRALQKALLSLQIEGAKRSNDVGVTRMVESFTAQVSRMLEIKDERKAKFLQHQIEEYEYAITQDVIYRNVIRWADREFSTIRWTDQRKAQKLVMEAMAILRENPNAPLSAIKDVTDAFYSLIKKDMVSSSYLSAESSGDTNRLNILSM